VTGELTVVTGVAGFVGAAVARRLAASGRRVRGTVRVSSDQTNLADFPGDVAFADLRDADSVARAMQGATELFHVAADYRVWAPDPEEIVRNNLAMTEAVMQAALAANVRRVVYTSSVATLLPLSGGVSDESRPARPEQATGAYKRSKVVAERLVERMVAEQGLPAVIVNPSTPIGPRDVKPTPTGRIIVEAANGGMPAYVDSGLNLVHVDDCAEGHLLALEKGRIGERYVLGGQDVPLSAMLAEIARILGRKPPKVELPVTPLFPLAWAAEQWARISGKEPFLTLDSLRMARHHMYYSSAKAEAELGYQARPFAEALADALDWFRAAGMVK
jgi:dihydroflavonol-4-reductase